MNARAQSLSGAVLLTGVALGAMLVSDASGQLPKRWRANSGDRITSSEAANTSKSAVVAGGMPRQQLPRMQKRRVAEAPLRMGYIVPSTFPVDVAQNLTLDQSTQNLYQNMADQISAYVSVPSERTSYYSAVVNSASFIITGWAGSVESVQEVAGGHTVILLVVPTFDDASAVDTDTTCYRETFFVSNAGTVAFSGATDANGWAGTMPGIFDY